MYYSSCSWFLIQLNTLKPHSISYITIKTVFNGYAVLLGAPEGTQRAAGRARLADLRGDLEGPALPGGGRDRTR